MNAGPSGPVFLYLRLYLVLCCFSMSLDKHVVIFSIGRSGSTLLQACFNSVPRVLIRGENNNFHHYLFLGYRSILDAPSRIGHLKEQPDMPWFGYQNYNAAEYLSFVSDLSERFLLDSPVDCDSFDVVGFKEIRVFDEYSALIRRRGVEDAEEYLAQYLDFLGLIFPGLRCLHLKRSVDDVLRSRWWARRDDKDILRGEMNSFNRSMSSLSSSSFLETLDYSDLRSGKEGYLADIMSRVLGISVDARSISRVLETRLTH